MATFAQLEFQLGETWLFELTCTDVGGTVIDLTGATTELVIVCLDGTTLGPLIGMALVPTNGQTVWQVNPADQAAILAPQFAGFECRAILADGSITEQAYGTITLLPSLFAST